MCRSRYRCGCYLSIYILTLHSDEVTVVSCGAGGGVGAGAGAGGGAGAGAKKIFFTAKLL